MSIQNHPGSRNTSSSSFSKVLDDTIKRNERENELLKQHKIQLQNEHILGRVLEKHEKIELQKDLLRIPKVKKTAPLSSERVLFLSQHGIDLSEGDKFYNIDYFMSLIDQLVESPEEEEVCVRSSKPSNPTKFPLRLDFTKDSIKVGKEYKRAGNHVEGKMFSNKIVSKSKEHGGVISAKKSEVTTSETSVSTANEGVNIDSDNDTKIQHHEQNPPSTSDKKSKNTENNVSDKKINRNNSSTEPRSRPRWMYRTIDPPEHGRYILKAKSKFISPKQEDIEKQAAEESRDVIKNPSDNKEDIMLNEKANDYRYKILAKNKMSSMFVPAPSQKNATFPDLT